MTFNAVEMKGGRGPDIGLGCDDTIAPAESRVGDRASGGRILLVEDEQPFRELLQAFLESQGYRVQAMTDGRSAARWLETNAVDVVVTDLCMPEVDGMELLMIIRHRDSRTPVIAMSGGVGGQMVGMLRAAGLLGARCTLEKPFSLHQLAAAVRETLASR
jgi:sigma-B regulation protein RsbU (phosphoserine phosphatase)